MYKQAAGTAFSLAINMASFGLGNGDTVMKMGIKKMKMTMRATWFFFS